MNAESKNIRATLMDQLAAFESGMDSSGDDVRLLADVQAGIGQLLGDDGNNEADIRRMLQERYESGELRKETFQLVKSMLDRFVTEDVPTSPKRSLPSANQDQTHIETVPDIGSAAAMASAAAEGFTEDDTMSSTMVLPPDIVGQSDSADSVVQAGSLLRDRFLLQEKISGGSMGVVYKALDRRLAEADSQEPWVAIKVLSPELAKSGLALRALQQEAAKGRCLVHPNIVRFIDLDRDDDLYFIVMEWLEGRTLADILDSGDAPGVDVSRVFEIVRQVGEALEYAHRCGIVHADVKPGNIMIGPDGSTKLFDFGVARVRQKQLDAQPDFDPGVLGLLTPAYSSMQVLTGETPTPADDVFSLGCLMYRMLAGYRVFGPRNAAEAAEEGMKPQRLEKLSDEQWRVLKKALSYSRVTRYETMAEFLEAIAGKPTASLSALEISAPARFTETEAPGRSGRWMLGLAALIGLLGAAEWQYKWSARVKEQWVAATAPLKPAPDTTEAAPVAAEPPPDTADEQSLPEPVVDEEVENKQQTLQEAVPQVTINAPAVAVAPLVDFSKLPPADAEIAINRNQLQPPRIAVTLREDNGPVIVDLVRESTAFAMTLRLEEVGFTGNRSPWVTGQYEFSNAGVVEFPVGQDRTRIMLTMSPDPLREADQQSTLRIREADSAGSQLGVITVNLEDDDQREFEAGLPANTVAFAASQASVRERDPAVQIDVLRFNPDQETLVANFSLRDITATQGDDYFAPGNYSITFGPGQRTTRLLIPLVQDTIHEGDEAFVVQLDRVDANAPAGVYYRMAVMIRDDE